MKIKRTPRRYGATGIAEHHLGRARGHHLKEAVVEVVVERHVEHQGVLGVEGNGFLGAGGGCMAKRQPPVSSGDYGATGRLVTRCRAEPISEPGPETPARSGSGAADQHQPGGPCTGPGSFSAP